MNSVEEFALKSIDTIATIAALNQLTPEEKLYARLAYLVDALETIKATTESMGLYEEVVGNVRKMTIIALKVAGIPER